MSMTIKNVSRFLLFGAKLDAKVSLENVMKRKAANAARGMIGQSPQSGPGLRDWLWQVVKDAVLELWRDMFGGGKQGPRLPDDLPLKLYEAIDATLRNRGGMADKELKLPYFWVNETGCTSTPFFWSMIVEYATAADPGKVEGYEMALEDAITRAGYDYNVRIQRRPLRIEIDKPTPPTVTLAELWPQIEGMHHNARWCVLGITYSSGRTSTLFMTLDGEDFSMFIAGSPGSGKTQLSMAIMLSLAMTNSPSSLSMVVIDPKAIDWRPYNALPHLALPVVNEPTQAAEVIGWLCDEMDLRTRRAARGDTGFLAHSICLYVDELSDLIASLPDEQADSLVKNIQRLGQKGRGVGFVVIGATQRVFDIPAIAHSKLNARVVGKMRNAGDSVAASGIPGTTTNKLPGRGSFELYSSDQQGCRIQAPFVAASDKPGYEDALQPFFDAIRARWQNQRPAWRTPERRDDPVVNLYEAPEQSTEPGSNGRSKRGTDPLSNVEFVRELTARYWFNPSAFVIRTLRDEYEDFFGVGISGNKAKAIFEKFMQQILQSSGDD